MRTLQIKCDLLKKQNEQQKQQYREEMEEREEKEEERRGREEDIDLNKVINTAFVPFI